ncbi:MAG: hypothetical protein NTV95_04160 [Candidatus Saccharibacteria bacterium]|nr:hypothetical protein [Candidatus Saccharibacteria bacterium]
MNYSNTTTSVKQPNNFIKWLKNKKNSKYIILAVAFAAVGSYLVFRSFAATNNCSVLNGATVCDVNMWVTGSVTGTGGEDTYLDTGNAGISGMFYGSMFRAPIKQAPGTVPVFRVKQNNTTYPSSTFHDWVTEPQKRAKESIYSQNPEGLVNEGIVFYAWDKPDAQPGTVPVYRLGCGINGHDSTRYTTDLATANAYKVKQANGFVCSNTTTDPNYLPFIAFYAYPPTQTIKPYYVTGTGTGAANTYDPGRLTGVTSISAGDFHTCAVITGGTVKCWGQNNYGQLGDGTTTDRTVPTLVPGLTGVTSVSSGNNHSCAVITGGTAKCWGANDDGQLGDGTKVNRLAPTQVPGLTGVTAISAGTNHSCALITGGTVKCWGNNDNGQLGDGTKVNRNVPTQVPGLTGVTAISVGEYNTCAVITGGTAKCWGNNGYGQLGDGTDIGKSVPTLVSGLTGVTAISTGNYHTCAVITGGTMKCWGENVDGQLGLGLFGYRTYPALVTSTVL